MLTTFHIIAIFQGIFLLIILFKNKNNYFFNDYFFLTATIISLLLYLLGDVNSNLFISDVDYFMVDNTLFITFLLLFLKYYNNKINFNIIKIIPFFIPVFLYVGLEVFEQSFYETIFIEYFEHFLYLVFILYLFISLFLVYKKVTIYNLKIPFFFVIISLIIVNSASIFNYFINVKDKLFFNTLLVIEITLLIYYMTYIFIFNDNIIHIPIRNFKYKNSSLTENDITMYSHKMKEVMEHDKLFLDTDLSLQTFSLSTKIPKHFISEILNIHLHKTFTQFVNEYRIEAFIQLYKQDLNNQFTIFGIANSVGFKNKSTFNSVFKKITGVSPSDYPKT